MKIFIITFLFIPLILFTFSACGGASKPAAPSSALASETEGSAPSVVSGGDAPSDEISPAAASQTEATHAEISTDEPSSGTPALSVGLDGFISADDAIGEIIFDKLGIKLIPVNVREDGYETLSAMSASGTLPDLTRINVASPFFAKMAEGNQLRDWTEPAETVAYPALKEIMDASDSLAAVKYLYGGQSLFMPLADLSTTDPGRIYYRKDWLAELGMQEPETADGFAAMLQAFHDGKNRPGLTLAGGVTYLIAMFGADPYSWINEDGRWIPAYYSNRMVPGLQYARTLFENGWLDFEYAINKANAAVNKFALNGAGSLIRHGDALWMRLVLESFADARGITVQEAYDGYVGVMPPFSTDGPEREDISPTDATFSDEEAPLHDPALIEDSPHWPRAIPFSGIIMPAYVSDGTAADAQALLNFILTDESAELAYFGIRGETSATGSDGRLKLFIDPATARPFDIMERYPSSRVLFLMGDPFSVPLPPNAHAGVLRAGSQYAAAVPDMNDGYLAYFIHTPRKEKFEGEINISGEFNGIVMGGEPVEEMFAAFIAKCGEAGVEEVIAEVNGRINSKNTAPF